VEPTYAAYEPFLNVDSVAHQERGTAGDSVRVKTYARPNERSWGRKNPAHIAGSVTFTPKIPSLGAGDKDYLYVVPATNPLMLPAVFSGA